MDINKTEILSRLKNAYGLKSDIQLAKYLQVAPNTISTWRSRSRIDFTMIFEKCEYLNWNYLIYGFGPPFLTPDQIAGDQSLDDPQMSGKSEMEVIRQLTQKNEKMMTELSMQVRQLRDELNRIDDRIPADGTETVGKHADSK